MSESKKPNKDLSGVDLNPDEVQKIADHFNKYIGDRTCHVCGEAKWYALNSIYTPDVFDRVKNAHRNDFVLATVYVSCKTCSTLTAMSADAVGVPHRIKSTPKKGS